MQFYIALQVCRCHLPIFIEHRVARIPTHDWRPIGLTRSLSCKNKFLVVCCMKVNLSRRLFRMNFLKICSINVNFQRWTFFSGVQYYQEHEKVFHVVGKNWIYRTYTSQIMCYSSQPRMIILSVGTTERFLGLKMMQRISIWMKSWNCSLWQRCDPWWSSYCGLTRSWIIWKSNKPICNITW